MTACRCSQRYNTPDRMVLDVTDFSHQTNYAEKGFDRVIYKRAILSISVDLSRVMTALKALKVREV